MEKNEDSTDVKKWESIFYKILPYSLLSLPIIMGCMISLCSRDEYIRLYFTSAYFGESKVHDILWGFTSAALPLGGCMGTFAATYFGSKIGRKPTTLIFVLIGLLSMIFYFLSYITNSYVTFFISRFAQGLGSGGTMNIGIIFMFESISEKKHLICGLLLQPLINIGILISSIFSLDKIIESKWFITAIPTTLILPIPLLALIILPESAFFVHQKYRNETKTKKILYKLNGGSDTQVEIDYTRLCEKMEASACQSISMINFLRNRELIGPIIVTTMIAVFQQLSGINIVIFYLSEFIKAAKFDQIDLGNVIMFSVCFIGSVLFSFIIPRTGSKIMMIIGFTGMSLSFAVAYGLTYFENMSIATVIFLSLYLFWFQSGPGPKPWSVFNETFKPEYQAAAQGYLTFNNWTSNFLITAFFPFALKSLKIHSVILFAVINIIFAIVLAALMVETKGKSYETITEDYKKKFSLFY